MNPSSPPAPLVTPTDELAAEAMVSEGGAIHSDLSFSCNRVMTRIQQQAEVQFYSHPLRTVLITFGVGVLLGAAARRVS